MHDVIVANGQWHGGAMLLAPEAKPDDGLFDVVLIGDVDEARLRDDGAEDLQGHVPRAPEGRAAALAHASRSTRPSACRSSSTASRSGRRRPASRSSPARCACVSRLSAVLLLRRPGSSVARLACGPTDAGFFFASYSSFPTRFSSFARRFSICSSPRTRFDRSSTRSFSCIAPWRPAQQSGSADALPSTSSPSEARRSSGLRGHGLLFPVSALG